MNYLSTINAILSSGGDDFVQLLKLSDLDPAIDLEGCDFSDVDFGPLRTESLNLRNCILRNADLSKVKATLILDGATLDGTRLPNQDIPFNQSRLLIREKIDRLQAFARFVNRFRADHLLGERTLKLSKSGRPSLIPCSSQSELLLYSNNIAHFLSLESRSDVAVCKSPSLLVNTKDFIFSKYDPQFLEFFRKSNTAFTSDNIFRPTFGSVGSYDSSERTRESNSKLSNFRLHRATNERDVFITQMRRTFFMRRHLIVIVVGYNFPFTESAYALIREGLPNANFIFLLMQKAFDVMREGQGSSLLAKAHFVYPNIRLRKSDIGSFLHSWSSKFPDIVPTHQTAAELHQLEGKYTSRLNVILSRRIFEAAERKPYSRSQPILI